jgi:hypothetical protein
MFGGAMISLILPKSIRSVTRDDIGTFFARPALCRAIGSQQTTQGKNPVFNSELADT